MERPGRPVATAPCICHQDSEPPTGLDYEIWQGPAPEAAYNNSSIVGSAWRWLFDYGTGDLGNDGVHRIDYCRHVMGLDGMPRGDLLFRWQVLLRR